MAGEGKATYSVKLTNSKANCAKFTFFNKVRIGKVGQYMADLLTGLGVPWVWQKIEYTLCCNGTYTIDYYGSHFPSQYAYLNKVKVGQLDQSNEIGAVLAGDAVVISGKKFHSE